MQDDLIDAYVLCIKKKRLVERVAKKVSFLTYNNIKSCIIYIDIVNSGL